MLSFPIRYHMGEYYDFKYYCISPDTNDFNTIRLNINRSTDITFFLFKI